MLLITVGLTGTKKLSKAQSNTSIIQGFQSKDFMSNFYSKNSQRNKLLMALRIVKLIG